MACGSSMPLALAVHGHEQARAPASFSRAPVMSPLLDFDRALVDAAPAFEHPWLTAIFVVISAWWVKGPLLVGLGLCSDLWRRRLPLAFAAAAAATGAASLVAHVLKQAFGRERPPIDDPALGSLAPIPDNPSFPSGHSATAFAAAMSCAPASGPTRMTP